MRNYWTCPRCGANLDPGEACDCGARRVRGLERAGEVFERKGREARKRAAARWDIGLDRLAGLKAMMEDERGEAAHDNY